MNANDLDTLLAAITTVEDLDNTAEEGVEDSEWRGALAELSRAAEAVGLEGWSRNEVAADYCRVLRREVALLGAR